jgi:hypothetical protein
VIGAIDVLLGADNLLHNFNALNIFALNLFRSVRSSAESHILLSAASVSRAALNQYPVIYYNVSKMNKE